MKTLTKMIFAASAAVLLSACGGGGDDEPSKDLFSIWTQDGTGATIDIRGASFGNPHYLYAFAQDGTQCICQLTVVGTQEQGSFAMSRCISTPYNSAKNPLCEAMNVAGNYTNASAILTLSTQRGSSTYR
ncbi:MAG: hypothetical protein AB1455_04360 [Pseudomonadota bacterium]